LGEERALGRVLHGAKAHRAADGRQRIELGGRGRPGRDTRQDIVVWRGGWQRVERRQRLGEDRRLGAWVRHTCGDAADDGEAVVHL
jgi:hypothetical protein